MHAVGRCYHDAYYPEIMDELGVCADVLPDAAGLRETLARRKAILLSSLDASGLGYLDEWVQAGGVLIGCMTTGLDELFGIREEGFWEQTDDEFTISGYLFFREDGWLPDSIAREYNLPVISPARRVRAAAPAEAAARLLPPASFFIRGGQWEHPSVLSDAVVCRRHGRGLCLYFSYGLAQTVRVLHQGRPVNRDWDGDGYYRSADGIVLTSAHDLSHPFADYHLDLLRVALDEAGIVTKHVLPPVDGKVSDLAFYYGGDDECDGSGVQELAAEKMNAYSLPYHINIMCDEAREGYALTSRVFDKIKAYGQETSIHFDFFKPRKGFTREEFNEQLDLYERTFKETPKAFVNHCMMFWGWTDQARWAAERGMLGDNGRGAGRVMPDSNPINSFGFPFGTSYPHYVYDDAAHADKRLPFVYIPTNYYEPRVYAGSRDRDRAVMKGRLRRGYENAWCINLFLHPVFIAREEAAEEALRCALETAREEDWRVAHLGVDAMAEWWFERTAAKITEEPAGTWRVSVPGPRGIVVRIPASTSEGCIFLDGHQVDAKPRVISGMACRLVAVPTGEHILILE